MPPGPAFRHETDGGRDWRRGLRESHRQLAGFPQGVVEPMRLGAVILGATEGHRPEMLPFTFRHLFCSIALLRLTPLDASGLGVEFAGHR
jgi:hypothetical protein